MNYTRLDSSQGKSSAPVLVEGQEQKIIPLFKAPEKTEEQKKQEESLKAIQEYIDNQDNKVVAFVIGWIKSNLLGWLRTEFKKEVESDILTKLQK